MIDNSALHYVMELVQAQQRVARLMETGNLLPCFLYVFVLNAEYFTLSSLLIPCHFYGFLKTNLPLTGELDIITASRGDIMEKLTARQSQVFEFIKKCIKEMGYPPTRAEIAAALDFRSVNAAEEHLRVLARKGAIDIVPNTSRGIMLTKKLQTGLPLIGRVAAGRPILAEQHIENHYQVDPALFRPKAHYLLRVKGQSMRDAGIRHGDLLAVHRSATARTGQIIVARIDDEVTVKRLERKRNQIRLLPANDEFEPIAVNGRSHEFAIEGIGVGIIRNGKLM